MSVDELSYGTAHRRCLHEQYRSLCTHGLPSVVRRATGLNMAAVIVVYSMGGLRFDAHHLQSFYRALLNAQFRSFNLDGASDNGRRTEASEGGGTPLRRIPNTDLI